MEHTSPDETLLIVFSYNMQTVSMVANVFIQQKKKNEVEATKKRA